MLQDINSYAETLRRYLRIVQPIEAASRRWWDEHNHDTNDTLNWPSRWSKTRWLQNDLDELAQHRSAPTTDETSASEPFDATKCDLVDVPVATMEEFIGVNYVTEGMTLGATVMIGTIRERLSNSGTETRSHHFFTAYGQQTGPLWKDFKCWVDSQLVHDQTAAEAAARTFDQFRECLSVR